MRNHRFVPLARTLRQLPLCLGLFALAVAAPDARAQGNVLFRINTGGPQVTATDGGPNWAIDTQASPSPLGNTGLSGNQVAGLDAPQQPADPSVPAYVPTQVFDTMRWDSSSAPELTWYFPVSNGSYVVNLMLIEGWSGAQEPGKRVFGVEVEGVEVEAAIDMYDQFGGYTPGMLSYPAVVNDGQLVVSLLHVVQNPAIAAIEVRELDPNGYLDHQPRAIDFGMVEENSSASPVQVTLANLGSPGDTTITISSVDIAGEFTHNLVPQPIAAGDSVSFDVGFSPTSDGPQSANLVVHHDGNNSPAVVSLSGEGFPEGSIPIGFGASTLGGGGGDSPTVIQFGPDGRLYVGYQSGTIKIHDVVRNGPNDYDVTATETLDNIKNIPNRNDDGSLAPGVNTRLMTGFVVVGTPSQPVIYASSSDERISVGSDSGLDTNSGRVTRLKWNGFSWEQLDLVRGLPRSEENHGPNGLAYDANTNTLYLAQGGHTNMGAPSTNFAFLPEYALSAAILSIDLTTIGESTYDLPTLDDPSRPNIAAGVDENDPFGGNDGANQAIIVPGGPVQVYSPGWRNQYDVILTGNGRMYSVDNGPNVGWGGTPIGCTNQAGEGNSSTYPDNLHFVSGPGYYAGHPNPTRGDMSNTWNGVSPVPAANPIECDYKVPGVTDNALATFNTSTNGLDEYSASNFGGAMKGDILLAKWDGTLERVQLNAAGDSATAHTTLISSVGFHPLDVTCQGDAGPFPGTIWVAMHGDDGIRVYEPSDYDGNVGPPCSGAYDPFLDEDGDGYSNADELDNGTNPCSAADAPNDFDGDLVSNLNDPDDDDDGIPDVDDAFALDPFNGLTTSVPLSYTWQEGTPGFGLLGLGFTGLMTNGVDSWLQQYDPVNMTAGGAAGKTTVDLIGPGTALADSNDLGYGFQLGVDVQPATGPVLVATQVDASFFGGSLPAPGASHGLQIGAGDQDHYLLLSLSQDNGSPALEVRLEDGGVASSSLYPIDWSGTTAVQMWMRVDPVARTVQPRVQLDGGTLTDVGPALAMPAGPLRDALGAGKALAVGLYATAGEGPGFTVTWDRIEVLEESSLPSTAVARLSVDQGEGLDAEASSAGSWVLENLSPDGQRILGITIDLSTALLPDLLFDPNGVVGDDAGLCLEVASGDSATGYVAPTDSCSDSFDDPIEGGYRTMALAFTGFEPGELVAFAADVDPLSTNGSVAPGPDGAAVIGAAELAGATVSGQFDDGKLRVGQLAPLPGGGVVVRLDAQALPRPGLLVPALGSSPASTVDSLLTVRLVAPSGTNVRLVDLEGTLSVDGAGYLVEPFDVNRAVALAETTVSTESSGEIFVEIELENSVGSDGIHTLFAVAEGDSGRYGLLSAPFVVRHTPPAVTDARARFAIDTGGALTGSTFYEDSFVLQNLSPSGQRITKLRVDLSTSLFPDMVFDPAGGAGDVDGLCFRADSDPALVGLVTPPDSCTTPFSQPRDGGYDVLEVEFTGFDPGEQFSFSVDVDPTSIQGATGVGGPGGVSGLELVGATITAWFDDGAVWTNCAFQQPGAANAEAALEWPRPGATALELVGVATPGLVTEASQLLRISGTPGDSVRIVLVEGELVVGGQFGPGYDIDPFEANNAILMQERTTTIGPGGSVDLPIILTRSSSTGGIYHIMASAVDSSGVQGSCSAPIVVEYNPSGSGPGELAITPSGVLDFTVVAVGDTARADVLLVHTGDEASSAISITGLSVAGSQATEFWVETAPGFVMAPGDSAQVGVAFAPALNGPRNSMLTVDHSGSNTPLTLSLSGQGTGGSNPVYSYRVNAGGAALTDWSGDTFEAPSPYVNAAQMGNRVACNTATIDMSHPSVPAGTPSELFACERWDLAGNAEMRWDFPVLAGPYELRLYFADSYSGTQGNGLRVFDVLVEGAVALDDFDIFAEAGGSRALVKSIPVTADSLLTIEFLHGVQNPLVNAIEIVPLMPDLSAGDDSLSVACNGQAQEFCVTGSYWASWPAGQDSAVVEVEFYRDQAGLPGNLLASFTDTLTAEGRVEHSFCVPYGTMENGDIFMVVDSGDALQELDEGNNTAQVEVLCSATDTPGLAVATRLHPNVPNPFNPVTEIAFDLARPGPARLAVYDVSGRLVTTLASGDFPAGHHRYRWDGRDSGGRGVSSGVYYYRLEAPGYAETRRMVLLK